MAAPAPASARHPRLLPGASPFAPPPRPRLAPLVREGVVRGMVEVEPDGMVDYAVRRLGARLVAVDVVIPSHR
ncbi:MAG: hypothetical protein ACRDHY_09140 [Anaerolineales bacterium]